MKNYGYVKVASAIPGVFPGNCKYNTERITALMRKAEEQDADIVCFPELCITGYTCQDLFESGMLLEDAVKSLDKIRKETCSLRAITIVGLPLTVGNMLANCAAVLCRGTIVGIVPKFYLPDYREFNESRWFAPARCLREGLTEICGKNVTVSPNIIFKTSGFSFGIEICEDIWAPIPRSSRLALAGAEIIFNLSADNESAGKNDYLNCMLLEQSARTLSGYVFSSCGFGESTQDLVFAGNAIICENGSLVAKNSRFCFEEQLVTGEIDIELLQHDRRVNTTFRNCAATETASGEFTTVSVPFVPKDSSCQVLTKGVSPHPFIPDCGLDERCQEVISIQTEGLAKRMLHTKAKTAVIGVSGGLDSTLALLVCARTFDALGMNRKNIIGITMPGFGTSNDTYSNAVSLMKGLGVTIRDIPIREACMKHLDDIGHNPVIHDITYENSQARERTQILMDVANQTDGFVVGTGDLSELALGWATYNGDHMSMYGVNSCIPKTLVKHLIQWFANNTSNKVESDTLASIISTPISPELIPPTDENGGISQKTEDEIGPYELHDFFLYYTLRYSFSPAKIFFLAQNAFGVIRTQNRENRAVCADTAPRYDNNTIKRWLKVFFQRFFSQQYKRSCLPDGPKVGSCCLSPRGDWKMPSDADAAVWLEECDRL